MAKKSKFPLHISDEMLAAFLDGNASPVEAMQVLEAAGQDAALEETLRISALVDHELGMSEEEKPAKQQNDQPMIGRRQTVYFPAMSLAAKSESNLCDVDCERYILRRCGIAVSMESLAKESKRNYWLREQGTPLHSIGRLLEQQGLTVYRRVSGTMEEIRRALINEGSVMVIVNGETLTSPTPIDDPEPNHAVVVIDYDPEMQLVIVHDPQSQRPMDCLPVELFQQAWEPSCRYMTIAYRNGRAEYDPQPMDVSDISLDNSLLDLRELIAENVHDTWALHRKNEGWTYGPQRNDALKQTPDMVPYSQLPETEKLYDRNTAMHTLQLIQKFGFEIVKKK